MTKPQLIDLLHMQEIAIPASRINGYLKKRFGTWSVIGGRLLLHLRLWMWAAVHHPDFTHFEIAFTKIIRTTISYSPYGGDFFVAQITLSKPYFYYFLPSSAETAFCKLHSLPVDTFSLDIPF
ncbi:MAG: hypothetical protein HC836_24675 [Richelia sp. RM2_1_2]|nr:hypothetical protein [Richelia sp. RM2_1_2]